MIVVTAHVRTLAYHDQLLGMSASGHLMRINVTNRTLHCIGMATMIRRRGCPCQKSATHSLILQTMCQNTLPVARIPCHVSRNATQASEQDGTCSMIPPFTSTTKEHVFAVAWSDDQRLCMSCASRQFHPIKGQGSTADWPVIRAYSRMPVLAVPDSGGGCND